MGGFVGLGQGREVVLVILAVDLNIPLLFLLFLVCVVIFLFIVADEIKFDLHLSVVHVQIVRGELGRGFEYKELAVLRGLVAHEMVLLLVLPQLQVVSVDLILRHIHKPRLKLDLLPP